RPSGRSRPAVAGRSPGSARSPGRARRGGRSPVRRALAGPSGAAHPRRLGARRRGLACSAGTPVGRGAHCDGRAWSLPPYSRWIRRDASAFRGATRAPAMGATWFDAGSTLAFVAAATERIGLLPHVLVLPYRHPLLVAKQYGTLDYLSGGRLILGVGSGHLKPEFKVLGADYERRGRVSDEYVAAIAAAWENEVARFDGETVAFHDVVVSPRVV